MLFRILKVVMLCQFIASGGFSQAVTADNIRLNQVGFYTSGPKTAIVINTTAVRFFIISKTSDDTVFSGNLKSQGIWEYSNESACKADFSRFNKEGEYFLSVAGSGNSHSFVIGPQVYLAAGKASLKMFYYQRASTDLPEKYAGKWARKVGHPDREVLIHPCAASATRPAGTTISCPGGWYDAGDYNKYIVNSGISTYTLLALYESFPKFLDTLNTNIPESGNNIPDILDEVIWNLRWMLSMQDEDGGVYHKLSNTNFDGSIMPEAAKEPRYVVKKSTAASLDLAAVTAQAYRVFKNFNKQLPGLADSCLAASQKAWSWAKKNPHVMYIQSQINSSFNPDIATGEYGDASVDDEFQWAAIELYIATGKFNYYDEINLQFTLNNAFDIPNWQKVNTLGIYSLLTHRSNLSTFEEMDAVKAKLIRMADPLKKSTNNSAFSVPMGLNSSDFVWGSNSIAANQGMLLIQAYNLTGDKTYLDAAIAALDYLLGRNGTAYSFLTGFGEKSTRNPHHRPSESDSIEDPVPGFLAGGPNPGIEDASACGGKYVSKLPATAYIDNKCSYASNEVAINWNAPFTYLILAIEAIKSKEKNK
jgi:endoglucanase